MNAENIIKKLPENGLDALLLFSPQNMRYASKFYITDGAVLLTKKGAFMFTDSRYIEAAAAQAKGVEVQLFNAKRPLSQCITETLAATGSKTVGAEEGSLPYGSWMSWQEKLGCALTPAEKIMKDLRSVKNQDEVDSITAAQRIAEKALDEVLGIIHPGMSEQELAAELTYRMMLHGGEGNSFDPIAITGKKTSMPHGVPGEEKIAEGDFVTMDFGCLKDGYCSDMTRTVAVGSASDEMRRVYDTVLEAQLAGIAAARAGATGADIHNAGAKVIADAGYGEYFGHGFGHSVGLDIHEAPNASPANKEPMPAGAVITAEPGIYLPGKFGVRIEDMLYITESGSINLTKAPKELIIIK